MKIRIVIIEDEYFPRQTIKKYIDELGAPYMLCGEADNGKDGLEILREIKPDIALVDITMPVMNGIDMIQQAQNESILTQMIILTGYSEFLYARAAVHLGVREYLLKPLRLEDLKKALEHVSKSLHHRNELSALKGIDMNNLLSYKLAEHLTRNYEDSLEAGLLLDHLVFPKDSGIYYVVLIQIHADKNVRDFIPNQLFTIALNILQENSFPTVGYWADNRSLCLVINTPISVKPEVLSVILKQIAETMYSQLKLQLKVALSTGCSKLRMIHDAYLEAQAVQQYYLFYDSNHVSFHTIENTIHSPSTLFDAEMRHKFMLILRKQDASAVKAFIEDYFHRIKQSKHSSDTVYLCSAEMVSVIYEYTSSRFEDARDLSSPKNALPALFSMIHVDSIQKFILERALEAIEHNYSCDNAHTDLIHNVHKYIEEHFPNSALCLKDLARANFISIQYLCSVYRRATQSTIGNYIFEVRMWHVQKLIKDGQRNVTVISEACGYDDLGYFCKCFRKKFSMTPKQYIESINS